MVTVLILYFQKGLNGKKEWRNSRMFCKKNPRPKHGIFSYPLRLFFRMQRRLPSEISPALLWNSARGQMFRVSGFGFWAWEDTLHVHLRSRHGIFLPRGQQCPAFATRSSWRTSRGRQGVPLRRRGGGQSLIPILTKKTKPKSGRPASLSPALGELSGVLRAVRNIPSRI